MKTDREPTGSLEAVARLIMMKVLLFCSDGGEFWIQQGSISDDITTIAENDELLPSVCTAEPFGKKYFARYGDSFLRTVKTDDSEILQATVNAPHKHLKISLQCETNQHLPLFDMLRENPENLFDRESNSLRVPETYWHLRFYGFS